MSNKFVSWEAAVTWLISQPDQQGLVRDCYYDGRPEEAARRYRESTEWQAIRNWLPATLGRAIDLGAGRGISSYALAKEGWHVVAIEPDASALVGAGAIREIANLEKLPIEVIQEFGERIPVESAAFDLVFARQVLHHARDLDALCRELFRVLKPGGRLVAVRDHVISSPAQLEQFRQSHPLHQLYGGENAYTLQQYLHALRAAGFVVDALIRPFDSVINYAPYSMETLREALQVRLRRFPLGAYLGRLLACQSVMRVTLALMSRFDQRPGRLCSFVCNKPGR